MNNCNHPEDMIFYYPKVNNSGWRCGSCQYEFGEREDWDKERIWSKVHGLLLDIHDNNFIYISNGTMGDIITDNIVFTCKKAQKYTQDFILKQIFKDKNLQY